MRNFLAELREAWERVLRLSAFMRVYDNFRPVGTFTLLVMLVLWLTAVAATNVVWAGSYFYFSEWGLVTAAASWAVFSVGIMLLARRSAGFLISRAIVDLAGIETLYLILIGAVVACARIAKGNFDLPPGQVLGIWGLGTWAFSAWMLIAIWRAGQKLWDASPRFAGLRFVVAALLPLFLVPSQPIISGTGTDWTRHDVWDWARTKFFPQKEDASSENASAEEPEIDYEATMYHQPALVDQAIMGLLPSTKISSQIYFVGFAPSSAQNVFKSEVLGAQSIFDNRFGTKGRSIVLINSPDTLASTPMASATNLGTILNGVGNSMNRERDILVLFITSHGSKELLSVQLPGFNLNQVTPDVLVKQLAESGIQNKVVIISACHAGSFIPALKSENTLIMAAASAEKTSFGCSNEREWTYFGDALFNHAFKDTLSMPLAFEEAVKLIEKWEAEQKLTSSEPQISVGAKISAVLSGIE